MSEKITICKNTVQETLVIPLYARKVCTEIYPSLFHDDKSVELVARLNYDFGELDAKTQTTMGRFGALETAMRQSDLAIEVKQYLRDHPAAAVVNMGCGLDQTSESCDNGMCKIYNLDFPDVIEVRNELIPPGDRTKNIAVNLNDTSWFSEIDASDGAIFFAAGVFYYFRKTEVQALFKAMAEIFDGGVIVFDAAGKKAVKMMIKGWVRQLGIEDVDAFFHVNDISEDIVPWLECKSVSSRGYMLGYNSLKDPSVSGLFRLLSKVGDNLMKMQIVKIEM